MGTFKVRKYRDVVYAIYTHSSRVFKVSTGLKVENKYWNNNKLVKSYPNYQSAIDLINVTVQKLIDATVRLRYDDLEPTVENVKNIIHNKEKLSLVNDKSFFNLYLQFIILKTQTTSEGNVKNVKHTYRKLLKFEEELQTKITIETFNKLNWYKFVKHLKNKGLSDNSINKQIKILKTFLNWAYDDRDFSFIKHKSFTPKPIVLKEVELNTLIGSTNLSEKLERVRDLFVFQCLTGMRYGDTQNFKSLFVKDGLIEYTQLKTKSDAIVPLFNKTKEIVTKYGGLPVISRQKYSDYLKELFKKLDLNREIYNERTKSISKLYEIISTHIGRKTFITTALSKGIPIQDVMKMSGHSDYKSMKPYIEINKEHIKEVSKKWEI